MTISTDRMNEARYAYNWYRDQLRLYNTDPKFYPRRATVMADLSHIRPILIAEIQKVVAAIYPEREKWLPPNSKN